MLYCLAIASTAKVISYPMASVAGAFNAPIAICVIASAFITHAEIFRRIHAALIAGIFPPNLYIKVPAFFLSGCFFILR